jgi:hypothetical protein
VDRDERPGVVRRRLVANDRSAFVDRHADVVEIAKRQRREPAAIDGRLGALGQLVKNSFHNGETPGNPKVHPRMNPMRERRSHFTNP